MRVGLNLFDAAWGAIGLLALPALHWYGEPSAMLAAQHVLEMFRRVLPEGSSRTCLDRLSNRLTKILSEARKLPEP